MKNFWVSIYLISFRSVFFLQRKWQLREKQLLEENQQLKQNVTSAVSNQELDTLKNELNSANETIDNLKQNFSKISVCIR